MLRWLGAGLILGAGWLARRTLLEDARGAQRTRRELAAAFESIEAEIRLLLTPMPALLQKNYGAEADAFFARVSGALDRGAALAEAWRQAADGLRLPDAERAAVAALGSRFDGGEESVCAALRLSTASLRRRWEQYEARRSADERMKTSVCIGISLFLAIILI